MTIQTQTEFKFFQLPPDTIDALWPAIRPRIVSGVERSSGRLTEKDAFDLLTSGKWQCWTYWEGPKCMAVVITRLNIESSGIKTLEAIMASGDNRDRWQRIAVDTLKNFAKAEGCKLFELIARPGWERVFTEFKKTHVMLEWKVD
jgi:hypothetical protein